MLDMVLTSLYALVPAYLANMAPVIAKKLNVLSFLDRPLDRGNWYKGNPLLGPHKTDRGVVVGVLAGIAAALAQAWLAEQYAFWEQLTVFPYTEKSALLWGFLLGGGALAGDAVKSFVKRRMGIHSGQRWLLWDQLDMVLGAIILGSLYFKFSWATIITVIVLTPLLGVSINLISHRLGIKKEW